MPREVFADRDRKQIAQCETRRRFLYDAAMQDYPFPFPK